MPGLENITVIIVTYLTPKNLLINCLKSIDNNVKIKIVENSKNFEFEEEILVNFNNVEIICTGENLGYARGNNIGLQSTDTDFALILNPDLTCDTDFFSNIPKVLKSAEDFAVIGCQYQKDKIFLPAGFFDKNKNRHFAKIFKNNEIKELEKVDWVTGCSMLINLKKFSNREIFDKNFFLYFEEFDLCKSLIKMGKNVFSSKELKIHHLGFKSSLNEDEENNSRMIKLKDWHYMWSSFYFYKKNYNYFYALKKLSSKFFSSFFKLIFYTIIFQKHQKNKYLYRFLGLLNSMLGRPSNFRG